MEKTTIPKYGKKDNNPFTPYLYYVVVRRNVGQDFLRILQDTFKQDQNVVYKLYKLDPAITPTTAEEKEKFDAVIALVDLLQKKYKSLPSDKLTSLTTLLKY